MYAISILTIFILQFGYAIASASPTICYLSTKPSPSFQIMDKIISQSQNPSLLINVKEFIISQENMGLKIKEIAKDQTCDGLVITDPKLKSNDFKSLICDPEIEDFFSKINAVWMQNNESVDFVFPNASYFGIESETVNSKLNTELFIPIMIGNLSKEKFGSFINPTKKLTQNKLDNFISILTEILSEKTDTNSSFKKILSFLSSEPQLIPGNNYCELKDESIEQSWLALSNKQSEKYISLKGSTPLYSRPLQFHSNYNWKLSSKIGCLEQNKISIESIVSTIKTFIDEELLDFTKIELIIETLKRIEKHNKEEYLIIKNLLISSIYFNKKFIEYLEEENSSIFLSEFYLKHLVESNSKFAQLAQNNFKRNIINSLKENITSGINNQDFDIGIQLLSLNGLLDSLALNEIKKIIKPDDSKSISLFIEAIEKSNELKKELLPVMESFNSTHNLSPQDQKDLEVIRKNLICYEKAKKEAESNGVYLHLQFTEIFESEFCKRDQVVNDDMARAAFSRILELIKSSPQITSTDLEVAIKQIKNFKNYYSNNKFKIEAEFFMNLLNHPQANSRHLQLILDRLLSHTDLVNQDNFWIMNEEGDIYREKLTKEFLKLDFINYPNLKLIKTFYERSLRFQFLPSFPSSDKIKLKAIKNTLMHLKVTPEETNLSFFRDLEYDFFELNNKKKLKEKYKQITTLKDKVNFLLENI